MTSTSGVPLRRMIRRQQLREMVPLADSIIYEMELRGEFRDALTAGCVVGDLDELQPWLLARRSKAILRAPSST